jgi:Cd(II)/Pb(II)-responsive transcriptional regulator
MRIGELGKVTGVGIDTIRYYEKSGFLPIPARAANGYRVYGVIHVERLTFIRHCRTLDMSLAEIRCLLDFMAHPEVDCGGIGRLIDEQLIRLRARIEFMRSLETRLAVLRTHCRGRHMVAECGILYELLSVAHDKKCIGHSRLSPR